MFNPEEWTKETYTAILECKNVPVAESEEELEQMKKALNKAHYENPSDYVLATNNLEMTFLNGQQKKML